MRQARQAELGAALVATTLVQAVATMAVYLLPVPAISAWRRG